MAIAFPLSKIATIYGTVLEWNLLSLVDLGFFIFKRPILKVYLQMHLDANKAELDKKKTYH